MDEIEKSYPGIKKIDQIKEYSSDKADKMSIEKLKENILSSDLLN